MSVTTKSVSSLGDTSVATAAARAALERSAASGLEVAAGGRRARRGEGAQPHAAPGKPGEERTITYKQLHREVCQFANVLKRNGIKSGDRILIYLPMVPEAAIAMLACARIGAVHSVVFGGFSAQSVADRIQDSQAKLVITISSLPAETTTVRLESRGKAWAGWYDRLLVNSAPFTILTFIAVAAGGMIQLIPLAVAHRAVLDQGLVGVHPHVGLHVVSLGLADQRVEHHTGLAPLASEHLGAVNQRVLVGPVQRVARLERHHVGVAHLFQALAHLRGRPCGRHVPAAFS